MTSIYDLVYDYIDRFYPGEKVDNDSKRAIHREIKRLLKRGWCSVDILRRFQQIDRDKRMSAQVKTRIGTNVRKLFNQQTPTVVNLLDPGEFYYHNVLRITSKPPKRHLDIDSGEIVTINDVYFLEMRDSFTAEDLVEYYCKQFNIKIHRQEQARFAGAFQWLLKMDDIEIILFMIDYAANLCNSEDYPPPRTPMDVRKYRREAMEVRNLKATEAVLSGGNQIVRKKRTRSS
ncbi:hypothetical protein D3C76_947930 [compost metagenome]